MNVSILLTKLKEQGAMCWFIALPEGQEGKHSPVFVMSGVITCPWHSPFSQCSTFRFSIIKVSLLA